jgi:hypothetical protein
MKFITVWNNVLNLNAVYEESVGWLGSFSREYVYLMTTLKIASEMNDFYNKSIQRFGSFRTEYVQRVI